MRNGNKRDELRKERKGGSLEANFSECLCAEKAIESSRFLWATANGERRDHQLRFKFCAQVTRCMRPPHQGKIRMSDAEEVFLRAKKMNLT